MTKQMAIFAMVLLASTACALDLSIGSGQAPGWQLDGKNYLLTVIPRPVPTIPMEPSSEYPPSWTWIEMQAAAANAGNQLLNAMRGLQDSLVWYMGRLEFTDSPEGELVWFPGQNILAVTAQGDTLEAEEIWTTSGTTRGHCPIIYVLPCAVLAWYDFELVNRNGEREHRIVIGFKRTPHEIVGLRMTWPQRSQ